MFSGKRRALVLNSRFLARQAEKLRHLFGKNPLPFHPAVKIGVVELSAANRANAIEDLIFFLRIVAFEPSFEKLLHAVGKTQRSVSAKARPGSGCGLRNLRRLRVGQGRDHRREQESHGNARLREGLDGGKTPGRPRGARLHRGRKLGIQSGERDEHCGAPVAGHLR